MWQLTVVMMDLMDLMGSSGAGKVTFVFVYCMLCAEYIDIMWSPGIVYVKLISISGTKVKYSIYQNAEP